MSEQRQRLVLSIITFLKQSLEDVATEDKESLDVAVQCIGETFGVDPSNEEQVKELAVPDTLGRIFDLYMKSREEGVKLSASPMSLSSEAPTPEMKKKANVYKEKGNALMKDKKYDDAIEAYTEAIKFDGTNPIYYSNRAAAYSSKSNYHSAITDANTAIELNPKFSKGYHRLGHAQHSLGDYKAAAKAFQQGLKVDPENISLKSGLDGANAKIAETEGSQSTLPGGAGASAGTGLNDALDMFGNLGGSGGMPDLASVMNNPAFMSMARQMLQGGGLNQLMENPAVANMMAQLQGRLPSRQELMENPQLRNLAESFGADMGGPDARPS